MTKHNPLVPIVLGAIATGILIVSSARAQVSGPVDVDTSDETLLANIDTAAVYPVKKPFTELTVTVDGEVTLDVLSNTEGLTVVPTDDAHALSQSRLEAISQHLFDEDVAVVTTTN